jgi:hypothetical protein
VVTAADTVQAAHFAVAIARAASASRRVALGDLAGDVAPVYALAGGEDAAGLADCFRDGLALTEVARPVPDQPSLFVLPSGARVRTEPALDDPDRWARLIAGFGEAGGLLVLVVADSSRLLYTLGGAGAVLIYAGPTTMAPEGISLAATVGVARQAPKARREGFRGWHVGVAAAATVVLTGGAAVAWTRFLHAPDGRVVLPAPKPPKGNSGPRTPDRVDTIALRERLGAADSARSAPFAIEVMAASTSSMANSVLSAPAHPERIPAATVAVVAVRRGAQGMARWHEAMFGAWRSAREADSALAAVRRDGVFGKELGAVVRVPYAILLADSVSRERARAVTEVWRAKGMMAYALTQDDGSARVYAGAFETVAQGMTMASMVRAAGGAPILAYRTGRPD